MYRKKDRNSQREIKYVCMEDLVPENHLLRQIEESMEFDYIYDEVKGLYSEMEWGKPGIDPVSLFKIVFIEYLYGIRSMRQTIREIEVNNAYRWFIGYDLFEPIPHFSTFGKNYSRRFAGTDIFDRVFLRILEEAVKSGFVDASAVYIDGTHIKASANKKKSTKVEIEKSAREYQAELEQEIAEDREADEKKPLKSDDDDDVPPETNTVIKSTTDPDAGMFHKGEHERQFAYVAQTASDRHGFVLCYDVAAGNVHDSQMFTGIYGETLERFPEMEAVGVDAGYKTPYICKRILDSNRIPCMPYVRPYTKEGFFKKYDYSYDEYYDCYVCPVNQALKYSTTNREGYREYKSDPKSCAGCPKREQCTHSKNHQKLITRHVWQDYVDLAHHYRYVPKYQQIYERRKETVERVFGTAKEFHGMRYTQLRGLLKVRMQVALTFACMNLKKLAFWKGRNGLLSSVFALFTLLFRSPITKAVAA